MDKRFCRTLLGCFCLVLFGAGAVQAEPTDAPRAGVCNCLVADGSATNIRPYCDKNEYLVGPDDPPSGLRGGSGGGAVPLRACCCPLPESDVLTDVHIYAVPEECPPDSIVTGGSVAGCSHNCLMRCTKINTERYRLGPVRKGVYWRRKGFVLMGGWGSAKIIYWEDIPAAIRLAHGRAVKDVWDGDGCAADPIGGLLVAKRNTHCDAFEFRELQSRQGVAIPMFPDCATEVDKNVINPSCALK